MKILSFGEILWDVYPDEKYIGGAPLNFAAHLAKHGEDVSMLSCVGNDLLGNEALKHIKNCGINIDYITISKDLETSKCLVTLDENSVPTYNLLQNVAYDRIPCEIKNDFYVLYFGTLALRSDFNFLSLEKLLNNNFAEVFVDINIRPPFYSAGTVRFAAEHATILKISLEEMGTVAELLNIDSDNYKVFADILSEKFENLRIIIITLGADGAFALDCATKEEFFAESVKTEVVSTVGAGDSFSAAFLHKYMKNESIEASLKYASKIAGFVVSEYDAVPEYGISDFN